MTWFTELTGLPETTPSQVRANLVLNEPTITCPNGRTFTCGDLQTPTLADLRSQVQALPLSNGRIALREAIANIQDLHTDPANAGALFQVASQFNLLEMVSPTVTPEQGIGIYQHDHTQGPACAIAAGAGTIYRNYFAPVNGQIGQSATNQIDCLADLGAALGNSNGRYWQMQNGYTIAIADGLQAIATRLQAADADERDALRATLRIGLQWHTQVTLDHCTHLVSQAYCSALPVAYSPHPARLWERFARLVLEAAYEATFCAAILNSQQTGNHRLYLTLLGGGAFGNQPHWITDAIHRAMQLYGRWPLDVVLVSYGRSNPTIQRLITQLS
jgi:hypothetical protein